MNAVATVSKNGSLAKSKSKTPTNFPMLTSWIDDWFNDELPSVFSSNFNTGITLPKVNIRETKESYFVDMAVPGLKKSDFQIDLDNTILSVGADLKEYEENTEVKFTRREFGYSSFKRTFTLPETIEESKIKASYDNGILCVELPKKEEAKQQPVRAIKVT